ALVVVTEWNEFKQLDLQRVKAALRLPIIVDGRNLYDPDKMADLGFVYRGVGRGYSGDEAPLPSRPLAQPVHA
ncbi:MAG: UDP-glucose 6-dehydrogenase, partial [Anaerolineae bacterium]|nr:UDP-glucose 6-dehydrogenase [Anaerolineae bacterium]